MNYSLSTDLQRFFELEKFDMQVRANKTKKVWVED